MKVTCTAFDAEEQTLTFIAESETLSGLEVSTPYTKSTQDVIHTLGRRVDHLTSMTLAIMLLFSKYYGGDFNDLVNQSVIY